MQRDYKEIMQTISFHKDFGKRNPIDIGIELGYSEREIEEMLRLMSVGEIPDDKSQVNDSQVGETVEEIRKYKKNSISEKIENSSCLYYDGRDICKKCADIIGINEYVELDKYLITSDENNNLTCCANLFRCICKLRKGKNPLLLLVGRLSAKR